MAQISCLHLKHHIYSLNADSDTSFPCILVCVFLSCCSQNLALALASVAVATLPTVAGMFPLWLAVTLHEGSTLLVALNSLRLLLEGQSSDKSSSSSSSSSKQGAAGHSHGHSSEKAHSH
jgi:hypothetical protein